MSETKNWYNNSVIFTSGWIERSNYSFYSTDGAAAYSMTSVYGPATMESWDTTRAVVVSK